MKRIVVRCYIICKRLMVSHTEVLIALICVAAAGCGSSAHLNPVTTPTPTIPSVEASPVSEYAAFYKALYQPCSGRYCAVSTESSTRGGRQQFFVMHLDRVYANSVKLVETEGEIIRRPIIAEWKNGALVELPDSECKQLLDGYGVPLAAPAQLSDYDHSCDADSSTDDAVWVWQEEKWVLLELGLDTRADHVFSFAEHIYTHTPTFEPPYFGRWRIVGGGESVMLRELNSIKFNPNFVRPFLLSPVGVFFENNKLQMVGETEATFPDGYTQPNFRGTYTTREGTFIGWGGNSSSILHSQDVFVLKNGIWGRDVLPRRQTVGVVWMKGTTLFAFTELGVYKKEFNTLPERFVSRREKIATERLHGEVWELVVEFPELINPILDLEVLKDSHLPFDGADKLRIWMQGNLFEFDGEGFELLIGNPNHIVFEYDLYPHFSKVMSERVDHAYLQDWNPRLNRLTVPEVICHEVGLPDLSVELMDVDDRCASLLETKSWLDIGGDRFSTNSVNVEFTEHHGLMVCSKDASRCKIAQSPVLLSARMGESYRSITEQSILIFSVGTSSNKHSGINMLKCDLTAEKLATDAPICTIERLPSSPVSSTLNIAPIRYGHLDSDGSLLIFTQEGEAFLRSPEGTWTDWATRFGKHAIEDVYRGANGYYVELREATVASKANIILGRIDSLNATTMRYTTLPWSPQRVVFGFANQAAKDRPSEESADVALFNSVGLAEQMWETKLEPSMFTEARSLDMLTEGCMPHRQYIHTSSGSHEYNSVLGEGNNHNFETCMTEFGGIVRECQNNLNDFLLNLIHADGRLTWLEHGWRSENNRVFEANVFSVPASETKLSPRVIEEMSDSRETMQWLETKLGEGFHFVTDRLVFVMPGTEGMAVFHSGPLTGWILEATKASVLSPKVQLRLISPDNHHTKHLGEIEDKIFENINSKGLVYDAMNHRMIIFSQANELSRDASRSSLPASSATRSHRSTDPMGVVSIPIPPSMLVLGEATQNCESL